MLLPELSSDEFRGRLFLGATVALVGALLAGVVVVCQAQVNEASERDAMHLAQKLAVAGCVAGDSRATFKGCTAQWLQALGLPPATETGTVTTLAPVAVGYPGRR